VASPRGVRSNDGGLEAGAVWHRRGYSIRHSRRDQRFFEPGTTNVGAHGRQLWSKRGSNRNSVNYRLMRDEITRQNGQIRGRTPPCQYCSATAHRQDTGVSRFGGCNPGELSHSSRCAAFRDAGKTIRCHSK